MGRILWVFGLFVALAGRALAVGSLAEFTVYDRTEHKNLHIYWQDGKAWVIGRPGNEYQVTLHNRVGGDVLAVLSVDGVNAVTGETAAAAQSGYVVETGHSLDIQGWRKSLDRTATFYFTELRDSYAARTGRPDNVGVIGVALFRRKAEEPPAYQPATPLSGGDRLNRRAENAAPAAGSAQRAPSKDFLAEKKSLGTGHGRNEESHAQYVQFERATTSPEETLIIYYDSRANLLARGVLPAEPLRDPRPFPAQFVRDPPPRW